MEKLHPDAGTSVAAFCIVGVSSCDYRLEDPEAAAGRRGDRGTADCSHGASLFRGGRRHERGKSRLAPPSACERAAVLTPSGKTHQVVVLSTLLIPLLPPA